MSDDDRKKAPVSSYTAEDTRNFTEDTVRGASNTAFPYASELGHKTGSLLSAGAHKKDFLVDKGVDVMKNPLDALKRAVSYVRTRFPPLVWFGYGAIALNAVPITIFLGFSFLTSILVLGAAGLGIFFAESFFIGIGLLFLLPVLGVMLFAGLTTACFSLFGYLCYRATIFVLRGLGVLSEEARIDAKGFVKGIKKTIPEESKKLSQEVREKFSEHYQY